VVGVSSCYLKRLFGIELCHGMIVLFELEDVGEATVTACWRVLPWISREGTKDNFSSVATETRTGTSQNQTRSVTASTIPLSAKCAKSVQMTNNVRS
jgi:hypothetical protein